MVILKRFIPIIFFALSFIILLRVFLLNNYYDFDIYYYWKEWINYPPVAIIFYSGLSIFPIYLVSLIWTFFSLISLFIAVYLTFKIYNKYIFSSFGFLVLGLVCLSFPVKFTLAMGQVNNFVLLIFVAAIYFLNKNKRILPMFLFALSFAIKLFPAYLLLYFVFAKKWKLLLVFVISLFLLSLAALIILGWRVNLAFYQNVLPSLINGWKTDYYNQSLTGFIGRSIGVNSLSETLRTILNLFFIVTTFITVFITRRKEKLINLNLSLLITFNLIVNNFSWQHHFVFLIFPFLATLFFILDKKINYRYLLFLFIAYLLIAFNLKNPSSVPVLLQSHVFYGTVLLWILEVFLILKNFPRLRPNSSSTLKHLPVRLHPVLVYKKKLYLVSHQLHNLRVIFHFPCACRPRLKTHLF